MFVGIGVDVGAGGWADPYPGASHVYDFVRGLYRSGASSAYVSDPQALGPELVVNGGFDTADGWTLGSGWSVGSGVATRTNVGGSSTITRTADLIVGRTYRVTWTLTAATGGVAFPVLIGGTEVAGASFSAPGTYTADLVAVTGNASVGIKGASTFAGSVDNVSVREVLTGFQFSRTGAGTADDSSGVYASFATNVPRRTNKGLLVEEGRQNLIAYSAAFSDAYWGKTGVTITPDDRAAPDGTLTADKVVGSGTGSNVFKTVATGAAIASKSFTATLWVYAESAFPVTVRVRGTGATQEAENFTGNTVAGQWVRVGGVKTFTAAADGTDVAAFIYSGEQGVDTSRTLWFWGAQLELGAFPTSPILTGGSAATRAGDTASLLLPSALVAPFTVFVEFEVYAADGTDRRALVVRQDPTFSERLILRRTSTNAAGFYADAGGVNVFLRETASGSKAGARTLKLAMSHDGTTYRAAADGAALASAAAAAPAGMNRLDLGQAGGGASFVNGYLRKVLIYPRALSDAELQALTQ